MADLVIKTNDIPVFKSKELNAATKKIVNVAGKMRKNVFEIASILSKVSDEKSYKADDFESAVDYAQKTFGFKKSAAYTLITIGKEYTSPELESNLPHEGKPDFTMTQIEKMLPLKSRAVAVGLIEAEEITSDMTCKEIEKVVKGIMCKGKETTETTDTPAEDEPIETEAEEVSEQMYNITGKSGTVTAEQLPTGTKTELYNYIKAANAFCTAESVFYLEENPTSIIKIFAEYDKTVIVYTLTPVEAASADAKQ